LTTTRTGFLAELDRLQQMLLEMGSAVDGLIGQAMAALESPSPDAVEAVLAGDDVVDNLDIEIEKHCIFLIALQQPTARDLRFIGSAMKISTDLERIADHAVDVAKVARKLAALGYAPDVTPLGEIAAAVRHMLGDALNAFVNHDLDLLAKVIADDDGVDARYLDFTTRTTEAMQEGSGNTVGLSYLLFAVHYLERVADHVVNIAERVSYVETGDDSRYSHLSGQPAAGGTSPLED
jgi:phosphate transport system protein